MGGTRGHPAVNAMNRVRTVYFLVEVVVVDGGTEGALAEEGAEVVATVVAATECYVVAGFVGDAYEVALLEVTFYLDNAHWEEGYGA